MIGDKKVSEILLQILTIGDTDRLYVATSGGLDGYMTGATLKSLASGNVSEVATFGALPGSANDGKLFLVLDASGDPALTDSTAAWYQYRTTIAGYVRVTSVEELAGGAGDMLKSVYDTDDDGKVDASVLADNIAGTPGNNKYYGTDIAGNKGFLNFGSGITPKVPIALTPTGTPADDIAIVHDSSEYYTFTPEAGGLGTLTSITNPPDNNDKGSLRLDTGGTPSVLGPDFDVLPSGLTLVGGTYRRDFNINTLNYWLEAGNLYGAFVESQYAQ